MVKRMYKKIKRISYNFYLKVLTILKSIYRKVGLTGTTIAILVAVVTLAVAMFPEPVSNITKYLYEITKLDEPDLIIEGVFLDDVTESLEPGHCSPFYYNAFDLNLEYQNFIADNPYHELFFNVRNNNNVTDGNIIIKNILVEAIDKREDLKKIPADIDCGAAGEVKVYTIIPEELKEITDKGSGTIKAVVDQEENTENFDFLFLNKDSNEEYIKLKLPMDAYGVLGIKVSIEAEYKNKTYTKVVGKFYIANSSKSKKYIDKVFNPELFTASYHEIFNKFNTDKLQIISKVNTVSRSDLLSCLDGAFLKYIEIIKMNASSDDNYQSWKWSEDAKKFTDDELTKLKNICYAEVFDTQ